ncbi:MAG: hypothetical protein CMJ58_21320 [Planctomycetaceae bacterium]|nr:hypothetical protein [Planctomycetaceae bacterium]
MAAPPDPGHDPAQTRRDAPEQTAGDDDSARRLARDVALATELLSCGALNEQQVGETLSEWSLYGAISLRQHLENKRLLSPEQLTELDQRVEQALSRSATAETVDISTGNSSVGDTIMKFDSTGRVAKLLGVYTTASPSANGHQRTGATRYRLVRVLGQGGLGRVWLARDLDLQRLVALKELSAGRESPIAAQRFRNEAEITGRLEHPGIVPIYQLSEDDETGRSFYTMRFLGKGTLQDSIAEYHERRGDGDDDPMLLQHLLVSFVSVCQAIGHAHSRRVIHRDLKPENVVIDNFGQVIVIDWGLAKLLDESEIEAVGDAEAYSHSDAVVTSAGQVLGTPLYMAPEQAAGRVDDVDERTDIYGLGAILFAICTGRPPHEAAQIRSGSGDRRAAGRALLTEIASGQPPRAKDVNPQIDPALDAICHKAMARRRYARYQQASDLAEDIQRWIAGQPVTAYSETMSQRVRRWIGKHQRLAQVVAGLLAVALAAIVTLAMAAKHSRIAAQQERFQQAVGDVREIELQLRDIAQDIGKDARFMASLPPIQGIVRARAGDADESEDVWLQRLETIYLGLLRANPDYLAVTFVAAGDDQGAATPAASVDSDGSLGSVDVLRVERNASDHSYLRTVPRSRLATSDDDQLLAEVIQQELGDVRFSLSPRQQQAAHAGKTRRMLAGVPVFDEQSGEPFGMVMIETDLNGRLLTILDNLVDVAGDTYIGSGEGEAWISVAPDGEPQLAPQQSKLADLCPEAAKLIGITSFPYEATDHDSYYGKVFRDNPQSAGVAVFVRLGDDD